MRLRSDCGLLLLEELQHCFLSSQSVPGVSLFKVVVSLYSVVPLPFSFVPLTLKLTRVHYKGVRTK